MIDYIMSSTFKWYNETLPIIIPSLLKSGISPDSIRIYVSASPREFSGSYMGCYIKFVKHNSYDYTSFIEYADEDRPGVDFFFSMHDTCEVDEDFKLKVENFDRKLDATYLMKSFKGICNFGMYRRELLQRKYEQIKSLVDCTKSKGVEIEGFMFHNIKSGGYPDENISVSMGSPYRGGTLRLCEHYKHVGLKKYKANWQVKPEWNYEL